MTRFPYDGIDEMKKGAEMLKKKRNFTNVQ